jgi:hypothetical protein
MISNQHLVTIGAAGLANMWKPPCRRIDRCPIRAPSAARGLHRNPREKNNVLLTRALILSPSNSLIESSTPPTASLQMDRERDEQIGG